MTSGMAASWERATSCCNGGSETGPSEAKYYTPEITKVKVHWKLSLNIYWMLPVKILEKIPLKKVSKYVGQCH